jgi:hypothetical protein
MIRIPSTARRRRVGFSLIEVLICIGIVFILVSLLLSAVMNVREVANRVTCKSKLGQLGTACHMADMQYHRMPPGVGYYPTPGIGSFIFPDLVTPVIPNPTKAKANGFGTLFFHLPPFIGQENLYDLSYTQANGPHVQPPFGKLYSSGAYGGWPSQPTLPIAFAGVREFICPSDPGVVGLKIDYNANYGASCYAYNGQVFVQSSVRYFNAETFDNNPRLSSTFGDGRANTILLAEKYATCVNLLPTAPGGMAGGTTWGVWPTQNIASYQAAFAIDWSQYWPNRYPYSTGPSSKFVVRPYPYNGANPAALANNPCPTEKASTSHRAGINVCMADTSVRTLNDSIDPNVWWALVTPNGNDPVGGDF